MINNNNDSYSFNVCHDRKICDDATIIIVVKVFKQKHYERFKIWTYRVNNSNLYVAIETS